MVAEDKYECALTSARVIDPVTLSCGHTFEREELKKYSQHKKTMHQKWIDAGRPGKEPPPPCCPMACNTPIPPDSLLETNQALVDALSEIDQLLAEQSQLDVDNETLQAEVNAAEAAVQIAQTKLNKVSEQANTERERLTEQHQVALKNVQAFDNEKTQRAAEQKFLGQKKRKHVRSVARQKAEDAENRAKVAEAERDQALEKVKALLPNAEIDLAGLQQTDEAQQQAEIAALEAELAALERSSAEQASAQPSQQSKQKAKGKHQRQSKQTAEAKFQADDGAQQLPLPADPQYKEMMRFINSVDAEMGTAIALTERMYFLELTQGISSAVLLNTLRASGLGNTDVWDNLIDKARILHSQNDARSKAIAANVFRLGAKYGNTHADLFLGICYKNGEGVPQSDVEAVRLFEIAANQGLARAQYYLGKCTIYGEGVKPDLVKGAHWIDMAAKRGDQHALSLLAGDQERGSSLQYVVGLAYLLGQGLETKPAQGARLISLAAEHGNKQALSLLNGGGIDQPIPILAAAQFYLGMCYARGEGVKQDIERGKYLILLAAEHGNKAAVNFVEKCFEETTPVIENQESDLSENEESSSHEVVGSDDRTLPADGLAEAKQARDVKVEVASRSPGHVGVFGRSVIEAVAAGHAGEVVGSDDRMLPADGFAETKQARDVGVASHSPGHAGVFGRSVIEAVAAGHAGQDVEIKDAPQQPLYASSSLEKQSFPRTVAEAGIDINKKDKQNTDESGWCSRMLWCSVM